MRNGSVGLDGHGEEKRSGSVVGSQSLEFATRRKYPQLFCLLAALRCGRHCGDRLGQQGAVGVIAPRLIVGALAKDADRRGLRSAPASPHGLTVQHSA